MTIRNPISFILLFLLFLTNDSFGQIHHIRLDRLTTLDDPLFSYEIFTDLPSIPVRLPLGDNVPRQFLTEFYSWKMTDQPAIVIMVVSTQYGDQLYIDKNLNKDLTDDGPPILFPFKQDTITFAIISPHDSHQRTKILFSRNLKYKTNLPDSSKQIYFDKRGNLTPNQARLFGAFKGNPEFKGLSGSYYFTDRLSLKRGVIVISGKQYSLGLYDHSNNGLYTDEDDVILVDVHGNGVLQYLDQTQVFKLNDVFSLAGHNFKIRSVDKYGTWVDLEETSEENTWHFIEGKDSSIVEGTHIFNLDSEVWKVKGITLNGDSVALKDYQGKYLLLNFWGEWCKPCIEEIPALLRAKKKYPNTLVRFISFVKINNLNKAKKIVADSGINWPQIIYDPQDDSKFKLRGYPTNILIFPDGRQFVILTGTMNDLFFKKYLK